MGEDDYPGIIPWKVSCTGVNYAKLRPISMKVFLIKRLREAPQSINVLATLCRPIGIFTMKGKFLSDSSVSRWSSCLNVILKQANLVLDLFSLRLRDDGHATSKDHINIFHLFITVRINPMLINPSGLLRHQRCWRWQLLPIQKSLALFHIVSCSAVNLAPLLCVIRTLEMSLLLLI
jgi:hypothetical protein